MFVLSVILPIICDTIASLHPICLSFGIFLHELCNIMRLFSFSTLMKRGLMSLGEIGHQVHCMLGNKREINLCKHETKCLFQNYNSENDVP